jgi:diguanylate cyclase (GGDEF)-like protein
VRKNATRYWANCVISVLRDPSDDSHIGFSTISRDRTLRNRNDEELLNLTITDSLTGAANRRGLFGAGLREDERRKRSGGTTSVLMLDLDHFTSVNDTHGHQAGDAILRHIVNRAKAEIRSIDLIGRYGGEEFTVVLPGSAIEVARGIAERIRHSVERTPLVVDGVTIRMTAASASRAFHPRSTTSRASLPPPTRHSSTRRRPAATAWSSLLNRVGNETKKPVDPCRRASSFVDRCGYLLVMVKLSTHQ